MEYKKGDKLLSRKIYKYNGYIILLKNKYYEIISDEGFGGYYFNHERDKNYNLFIHKTDFETFFYTKKEIRKLKLKRLNKEYIT